MTVLFLSSCAKTDDQLLELQVKTVEGLKTSQVLAQLLIATDNDKLLLCRVLGSSPSTFDRLFKEETYPTRYSDKEIRNLLKLYYWKGADAIWKLDPEDRWFDVVDRFLNSISGWTAIYIFIVLIIITILWPVGGLAIAAICFLLCVSMHMGNFNLLGKIIHKELYIEDNFKTVIDTTWETLN